MSQKFRVQTALVEDLNLVSVPTQDGSHPLLTFACTCAHVHPHLLHHIIQNKMFLKGNSNCFGETDMCNLGQPLLNVHVCLYIIQCPINMYHIMWLCMFKIKPKECFSLGVPHVAIQAMPGFQELQFTIYVNNPYFCLPGITPESGSAQTPDIKNLLYKIVNMIKLHCVHISHS